MDETHKVEQGEDDYKVIVGPSFSRSLPGREEWQFFVESIQCAESREFAALWLEKAQAANGIPLRSDFDFRELVKYGKYLILYKLTQDNRWLTTFCGDGIVEDIDRELTGKHLDDYAEEKTLDFWMKNIQLMLEDHKPIMEYFTLEYTKKQHKMSQSLNLPLKSGAGDTVDMFICHEAVVFK